MIAIVLLAGCAGPAGGGFAAAPSPQAAHRGTADAASAMPGDAATAMPGDAATAMPGANFACAPALATGAASCTLAINVNVPPVGPSTPAAMIGGLHPSDLTSMYALPAQNGGGLVAIVDAYDAPSAESDLAVYRAAFGLPACTSSNGCFRRVDQHGGTAYPQPDAGWSQEAALDLEMVSAICPKCSLVLVEANSSQIDDLGAAVDTAAALRPAAISNSYYALEWANETDEDLHYRHPGIAITASSGDRGKPSYPAVSHLVTAVGGTSLASGSETAWAYGGSGCSAYVARPGWARGSCRTRTAVDVAAIADPATGVAMFDAASGGWLVAGGTSVGAPLVAAAYALGTPAGPAFSYAHPAGFHAIAASGYDAHTGLGSPAGISGL
ncbi:MAG TPA: hypothetical protein VGN14_02305 [Candidatus Elarobacter sp.]